MSRTEKSRLLPVDRLLYTEDSFPLDSLSLNFRLWPLKPGSYVDNCLVNHCVPYKLFLFFKDATNSARVVREEIHEVRNRCACKYRSNH